MWLDSDRHGGVMCGWAPRTASAASPDASSFTSKAPLPGSVSYPSCEHPVKQSEDLVKEANMSYYDIDSILTDAEKVPCKFELDVADLGYLDNNPSHALKAGTNVSLPLWLAEMLALANAGTGDDSKAPVTLNLPPSLSNQVVQALKADARSVPVRDQSAHFYGLGTRILDLFDERDLSDTMRKTFIARASEIALHARKGGDDGVGGSGEEFLRGLDEWERGLFRKAHDGTKASKEWMDKVKKH